MVHADVQLLCGKTHQLSLLADDYYYYGWPVEDIRRDIAQKDETCSFSTYLSSTAKHDLNMLESRLHYAVNSEQAAAQDRLVSLSTEASRFYIEGIEQPTEKLEKAVLDARNALESEEYDNLSYALSAIGTEYLQLSAQQAKDIEEQITHLQKSINDISFIASFYSVRYADLGGQVAGIADSRSSPLSELLDLQGVRNSASETLNEAVSSRGGSPTEGKWILIAIRAQHLYMIEDYTIIYDMPVSTGIYGHQTGLGEFQVYEKVPMAWGYYRIWMPYWLTIYYSGGLENGIHGIPISPASGRWDRWDNAVGNYPITYGCVMPHDWDAKTLYDWAEVGIPVSILP
jgi:hypothetical protein